MKSSIIVCSVILCCVSFGQSQKTEVLTLGVFHFAFPNLDIQKTSAADQIDVLESKYQLEIESIVRRIARFKPTIIAIERQPGDQSKYDSLYNAYLRGDHQLTRDEEQQIGFRIAKLEGIKKLFCIDCWGKYYEDIAKVFNSKDSTESKKFEGYFHKNPDTAKRYAQKPIFKTKGILSELRRMNSSDNTTKDLGNYLIGVFKYETKDNTYFGPDFVTGWWFNRNLRIFRNLQRIDVKPTDKILVIYGAGHLNILNNLLASSPEYKLVKTNDYLK